MIDLILFAFQTRVEMPLPLLRIQSSTQIKSWRVNSLFSIKILYELWSIENGWGCDLSVKFAYVKTRSCVIYSFLYCLQTKLMLSLVLDLSIEETDWV
jgi:hypothetical protein